MDLQAQTCFISQHILEIMDLQLNTELFDLMVDHLTNILPRP